MICRWIGNAAEDGLMATVFARLQIPAPDGTVKDEGVHAFIVPLRHPETKRVLPGVEIIDNGYKVALCSLQSLTLLFELVCLF